MQKKHLTMSKYLFIFLSIFLCQVQQYLSARSVTALNFPNDKQKANCSVLSDEVNNKPLVHMSGQNNYQLSQQIFYVYGTQKLKIIPDSKHLDKLDDNYLVTPGIGAHKLHIRSVSWNKARRACIQEGGHLAIINSFSEEKILLGMLQDKKIDEAHLGLHDLYEEGDWVTILDQPLETTGYTRWTSKYPNEPDNNGGNQNCAVLLVEGGMDDINCALTKSFFCEIAV